jgi:hypothetical protein
MQIDYGVPQRPLVVPEAKEEMVAGSVDHPDRVDCGDGCFGWDVRAGALYLHFILI